MCVSGADKTLAVCLSRPVEQSDRRSFSSLSTSSDVSVCKEQLSQLSLLAKLFVICFILSEGLTSVFMTLCAIVAKCSFIIRQDQFVVLYRGWF